MAAAVCYRRRMTDHVAIIGCGFSGALQAINLRRFNGPKATIIDNGPAPGLGLAYGAAHPSHILNVRASRMSALPDEPDHFVRWLSGRGVANPASAFIPRMMYGEYLRELLEEAVARSAGKLELVSGTVEDLEWNGQARLRLTGGRAIEADAAVLAVGNLPPHTPPGIDDDALSDDSYVADPWSPGAAQGLSDEDTVLILGTGLTMVDIALLLDRKGFKGRIVAMSRRGLLPHAHADTPPPADIINERPRGAASNLVRQVRERSGKVNWRDAVDELRPFTQALWRSASDPERARFLRHLRPWWDVHRHRIAPAVAAELQRMQDEGRLEVRAGKPVSVHQRDGGIHFEWRPRGSSTPETLRVRRIINCTGPQGDLLRSNDPLLRNLMRRGSIRPDALRLGIDVDSQSRTVDAKGASNEWLYALGPMTRGAFWEIVAVPDIRSQTWSLARWLSNAHWVGGEGL